MRLAHGVGINDADYPIYTTINGTTIKCPYNTIWSVMIQRCYSERFQDKYPTYKGCTVDDRWIRFMQFRDWMMTQDWEGKSLDKDIIVPGNKVYGPDTATFVTRDTNQFIVDRSRSRGQYPIGACWHSRQKKFAAQIGNGSGKPITLGYFDTAQDAHLAWKAEKHRQALVLADKQTDSRVAEALRIRYL
jgi:hypothetical protein